mmetsp:Transcript_3001/g.11487  ORF Transcript_3001/g.11487 Transcript_3001/m.11487 type:complete len:114 (+) Transcript_3001:920-1261(+)
MPLKSFQCTGKVQGVMFRQTFIRCCKRHSLSAAGVSNSKANKSVVTFTIKADESSLQKFLSHFKSFQGKAINSWNGKFVEMKELDKIIPIEKHQVTMENVDKKKWNPNVQFFL